MHIRSTLATALSLLSLSAAAAEPAHPDILADPATAQWGPAPAAFPPGAQVAVLSGNPFAKGQYVLRLKLPAGYRLPAHQHPTVENVTVISGEFHAGMGDKLDESKGMVLKPGAFAALPAKMNHFAWATAETVVQVHGTGPFAITYANPADKPGRR